MKRNKSLMEQMIEAMENTGDLMLRYQYQKQMLQDNILAGQERKQLVSDVADEVLSRINITVDATDVIDEIDELRRAIDKLERK